MQHPFAHAHRIGVIDIGSNSIRLVVYDETGRTPPPLFNEKMFCGLGRGLALTGKLNPEGKVLARQSLARLLAVAQVMDVTQLKILATAAIRDASDGKAFTEELEKRHNVRIAVITGRHEARLAASGVMASFWKPSGLVGDLGGGSMELIALKDHTISAQDTMPIGPLRLLDSCRANPAKMGKAIAQALGGLSWLKRSRVPQFYAVGGSFRALARIHQHESGYPLPLLHHYRVTAAEFLPFLESVQSMSESKIAQIPGISSKRVRMLKPAAQVLTQVLEKTGARDVVFSTSGIREGYLYEKLTPRMREEDPLIASAVTLANSTDQEHYANDLFDWMAPLAKGETEPLRRLRLAACHLSEIADRVTSEYRADWAYHHVLQSSLLGLEHVERATLALMLYYRYQPKLKREFPTLALIGEREKRAARVIGLAMSLAYQVSGGLEGNLDRTRLKLLRGKVSIQVAPSVKALLGDTVRKRVDGLGEALKAASSRRR